MSKEKILIEKILENLDEAKELQLSLQEDWSVPSVFYKFYHQSFKVYYGQRDIKACLKLFAKIAGDEFKLNKWYLQIAKEATANSFSLNDNGVWLERTRPIVEATLHSKMFLDLIVENGEKLKDKGSDSFIPSCGWGAVLYLFNIG